MGCAACANKITTQLRCLDCTRIMPLRHNKELNALEIRARRNLKCSKCSGEDFEIV
jgi:DNA-directed RNA polymerase subunit RPC12/RpoP